MSPASPEILFPKIYVPGVTSNTTLLPSASLLLNKAGPFSAFPIFKSPHPKFSSTPFLPISVAVDKIGRSI